MQHLHECNGPGLPDYPNKVTLKDVNVWMHDSGMLAIHDYSCPVCRETSAILDLNTGLMQPCLECQEKGYKLVKFADRKWWQFFVR